MMTELGPRLADTVEIRLIGQQPLPKHSSAQFSRTSPLATPTELESVFQQEQTDQGTLLGGNPPTGFTPRYRRVPQSLRSSSEALASERVARESELSAV